MKVYRQDVTVRFHQADPAGILFFANVFQLAHDTYEGFLAHLGIEWSQWFENSEWAVPIRHAEADYLRPLRPPETYEVTVSVDRLGKSSFVLKYVFSQEDDVYCEVTTAHTFMNIKTKTKTSIPADIRSRLESYQRECLTEN